MQCFRSNKFLSTKNLSLENFECVMSKLETKANHLFQLKRKKDLNKNL